MQINRQKIDFNRVVNCFPCVEHNLTPVTKFLNAETIITEVCKYLGISVGRIISNKKTAKLVNARHMICDILYRDRFLHMSLFDIGRLLGGRHHTTIIHAVNKISDWCETDLQFREQYRKLYVFLYDSDNYFLYTDKYYDYMRQKKKKKIVPIKVVINDF